MQPNEITLPVDEENNSSPTNHVFSRYDTQTNRSIYVGPDHTMTTRNLLALYRSIPKPNGNFRGVAKTAAKFTRDVTVLGIDGTPIVAPVIIEVSFAIPVGTPSAEILVERQKAVALLDLDSVMVSLNETQMI